MDNPLSTIFLILTEAGTEKTIRVRADLVGALITNSRGSTDVWTQLSESGESKVFIVDEEVDSIMEGMLSAMKFTKSKNDKGKR